jgi:dUTPase
VEKIQYDFKEIKKPPVQKTERNGGFGSTGT